MKYDQNKDGKGREKRAQRVVSEQMCVQANEAKKERMVNAVHIRMYKINIVHNAPEQQSCARARSYYAETGFGFSVAALFL